MNHHGIPVCHLVLHDWSQTPEPCAFLKILLAFPKKILDNVQPAAGWLLVGKEGMEKNMEAAIPLVRQTRDYLKEWKNWKLLCLLGLYELLKKIPPCPANHH